VALLGDAEFFHTPDQRAFVTVAEGGRKHTLLVASDTLRTLLGRRFFRANRRAASRIPLDDAIGVLYGRAIFGSPTLDVAVRVAGDSHTVYLDLGDDAGNVVEITASGWQLVKAPAIRFLQPPSALPLPVPTAGGSVDALRDFLNLRSGDDFRMIVGWLLACLRPQGPYPVLDLYGEQGSGKSILCQLLRALVDPNKAPLRGVPKSEHDLAVGAQNSWVMAFDNLSHLPPWFSDGLCRLSSGAGFSTRTLNSNADETVLTAQRPILVNGITDVITRSDLLDRSFVVNLPRLDSGKRRSERAVWSAFNAAAPGILGALCDAVAGSLASTGSDSPMLDGAPRLADTIEWVGAAEPALGWPPGTFLAAYRANQQAIHGAVVEASSLASEIVDLCEIRGSWEGTADELLDDLDTSFVIRGRREKGFPTVGNHLVRLLRRLAPNLRGMGVSVEFHQTGGTRSRKMILLKKVSAVIDAIDATDASSSVTRIGGVGGGNGSNGVDGVDGVDRSGDLFRWQDIWMR